MGINELAQALCRNPVEMWPCTASFDDMQLLNNKESIAFWNILSMLMKRSWNLTVYAFTGAQNVPMFSVSFPCLLAHNGKELNIQGYQLEGDTEWFCMCVSMAAFVFFSFSVTDSRGFYFILVPSHPQWPRGFVLLCLFAGLRPHRDF